MIEQVSERSVQLQRFKSFDACCCSISSLVYKTEAQTITHLCRSKTEKKRFHHRFFATLFVALLLDGKRCSWESYGSFFKNRA